MPKSPKINQIAIDAATDLCYHIDMKNNNTNKGNDMNVRVIKHINGSFNTFANFATVQDALDYMRRLNVNDSWYIIDANDNRLKLNQQGKLVVFNSLIGY